LRNVLSVALRDGILVKAADSIGNIRYLQLAAYIKYPNSKIIPLGGITNNASPSSLSSIIIDNKGLLWLGWPAYLIVIVMVISFWLGEKQELKMIAEYKTKHRTSK